MSLPRLAIHRPVATTMSFAMILVVGLVSWRLLPVDLLPRIEQTQLTVRVAYPNVGPEEIEQLITDRIENAVAGLPNLERMVSTSEEGRSQVRLDFSRGTSIDEAANDLRAALDRLRDLLPDEADAPEILKLDLDRSEVVGLAATSTLPLVELTRLLEDDLARRFEQVPGVGSIELRGAIRREIRVELDQHRLAAAGLDALDVYQTLSAANTVVPGGILQRGYGDLAVRAVGDYRTLEEIRTTVVAMVNGLPLRIDDVARVSDANEDVRSLVEINGVPSVALGIQKQSGANTVEVADGVLREIARINDERDDVHLTVVSDQSLFIRESMASVQWSAVWGSLLAIGVLQIALRNRTSTAIIGLAIPVAVVSSFGLLYFGGLTLNQMTFGGLALGVGLIVDNAIVVLESIQRKREEEGLEGAAAAIAGAREVTGAIVASTLTTCVVFLPVVFGRTTSGALFQALALVVVFALACSLLVALTLVPMLGARQRARPDEGHPTLRRLERRYVDALGLALAHRGKVLAGSAAAVLAALAMLSQVPMELAPQTEADEIDVELEMAPGTSLPVARRMLDELEVGVRAVLEPEEVRLISTEVRPGDAEVELPLAPRGRGSREASGEAIAERIRDRLSGIIPGAEVRARAQPGLWILRRIFSSGGGDDAIELEIRDWDLARGADLAQSLTSKLSALPEVVDPRVEQREGRREALFRFRRERVAQAGLEVATLARMLQLSLGGLRAGSLREEGDEIPIVVRSLPSQRLRVAQLEELFATAPDGRLVPFSSLVEGSDQRAPQEIVRIDGQRVTRVTAGLAPGVALGEAIEAIDEIRRSLDLPRGVSVTFGGEYLEQIAARKDFVIAIVLALVLVYMLMAAQFERYLDPLVVMSSVPVALVGVAPVLLLTGTTLNIQSVMGLVMLIGIVVNNAIVLVDTINHLRAAGTYGPLDAIVEAARRRLRPILITTTTTVLGLLPLALGIGPGAGIQSPLARVVIGGLVASTAVTLVLVPIASSFTSRD